MFVGYFVICFLFSFIVYGILFGVYKPRDSAWVIFIAFCAALSMALADWFEEKDDLVFKEPPVDEPKCEIIIKDVEGLKELLYRSIWQDYYI